MENGQYTHAHWKGSFASSLPISKYHFEYKHFVYCYVLCVYGWYRKDVFLVQWWILWPTPWPCLDISASHTYAHTDTQAHKTFCVCRLANGIISKDLLCHELCRKIVAEPLLYTYVAVLMVYVLRWRRRGIRRWRRRDHQQPEQKSLILYCVLSV